MKRSRYSRLLKMANLPTYPSWAMRELRSPVREFMAGRWLVAISRAVLLREYKPPAEKRRAAMMNRARAA
jgi:hypothetical protein